MATAQEALEGLKSLVAGGPEVEVGVAFSPPDAENEIPGIRVLNLAPDAEDFFRSVVKKAVIRPSPRWNLRPLDPVYKPEEHEVEHGDLDQLESVKLALDPLGNLASKDPFSPSDAQVVDDLRYSIIVFTGANGQRAYFFRVFTASNELQRKPWAALVLRDGAYTEVEEKAFLFNEQIDCFVFDGKVFVINKNNYRKIFDLLDRIRSEAGKAVEALNEVVPIANLDEFKQACCSQTTMADKIIEVSKRDYFHSLSVERLKPVINEFGLNVQVDGDGNRLIFDPRPEGRWHILRLVDDDYLRSSLTQHRYEVNSKTSM